MAAMRSQSCMSRAIFETAEWVRIHTLKANLENIVNLIEMGTLSISGSREDVDGRT